jgi:hypothetical protein
MKMHHHSYPELAEILYTAWAQSERVKILWPDLQFQKWETLSPEHKEYWITISNNTLYDYALHIGQLPHALAEGKKYELQR